MKELTEKDTARVPGGVKSPVPEEAPPTDYPQFPGLPEGGCTNPPIRF